MSALDHTNPNQLAMFYPARQVKATHGFLDGDLGTDEYTARTTGGSTLGDYHIYESGPETHASGWEQKADAADEKGITNSLMQGEPIRNPLVSVVNHSGAPRSTETDETGQLKPYTLYNGHHRLAGAMDVDPSIEVPVIHHENSGSGTYILPGHEWGSTTGRGGRYGYDGPVRDLGRS